jgi:signal transduction histidine kinase
VIKDFSSDLSEKIHLVFTSSQTEPILVNADKVRISEVISNLLGNAIKFTTKEAGRSIMIEAEKVDSKASVSIKDQKLCQSYFQNLLQIRLEERE